MSDGKRSKVNRKRAAGAACLIATLACGESTGPGTFNLMGTSQAAQEAFRAVGQNPAVTSLSVLGSALSLSVSAADGRSGLAAPAANSAAPIFPADALGKTYVYNPTLAKYEQNPSLPGAPSDGVRFVLYAVDPLLHRVVTPLQEIGPLDLRDKSTPSQNTIGIKAVANGATVLEYDANGAYTSSPVSLTFSAAGFASDGNHRLDFDLSQQLSQTGVTLDYELRVPGQDLELHLTATGTEDLLGTVTLTVTESGRVLEVRATGTASTVSGSVKLGDESVATISGTPTQPVFTGAGGRVLSAQDLEGLNQLFDFVDQMFEAVDNLITPAYFIFGINLNP